MPLVAVLRIDDELADRAGALGGVGVAARARHGEADDTHLSEGDQHPEVRERRADDGLMPGPGGLVGGRRGDRVRERSTLRPGPALDAGEVDGFCRHGEAHGVGDRHGAHRIH